MLAGGSTPFGIEKESLQYYYEPQGHVLLENRNYAARCRVMGLSLSQKSITRDALDRRELMTSITS